MSLAQLERGHENLLEAYEHIQNNRFLEAEKIIEKTKRVSPSDRRFKEHLRSKIHFHKGEFDRCIHLLDKAMDNHGNHVGLLSDKACALYLKKDYFGFEESVARLESEFNENDHELSVESYVKTAVCLGKFYEELGHVEKALRLYERTLEEAEDQESHVEMVLAQLLRLKTQWNLTKDIEVEYKRLFNLNEELGSENFNVEIFHALSLAETSLFERKVGEERILEREGLSPEDRNLIACDYLEIALRKDLEVNGDILSLIDESVCDDFEATLLKIHRSEPVRFSRLSGKLPLGQILRLMALVIKDGATETLEGQFTFLLETLTSKNRAHWTKLIERNGPKAKKLEIDLENSKLAVDGKVYDFKRKSNAKAILGLLSKKSKLTLDEAIKDLYNVEYDESFFHRLRVAVKRLNEDLAKALLVSDVISVNSSELKLKEGIKLS